MKLEPMIEHENLTFIWGLPSRDIGQEQCGLNTPNDIDIVYNNETKKYTLGVETIYEFASTEDEIKHYIHLADAMCGWFYTSQFANDRKPIDFANWYRSGSDVFDTDFDTVYEAIAWYCMYVDSMCRMHHYNPYTDEYDC